MRACVARSASRSGWLPHLSPISDLAAQGAPPVDAYRVVKVYPHDPAAYTQGLIYRDGFLYESAGLRGRSSLRKVKLDTGEVMQQRAVDQAHFAEGLADGKGQLVQLTWQSNVAFVYDLLSFAPRRTFSYSGEGWVSPTIKDGSSSATGPISCGFSILRRFGRSGGSQSPTAGLRSMTSTSSSSSAVRCTRTCGTRPHRQDLSTNGTSPPVDRSARPAVAGLPARCRGRAERHRARRRKQSPVRDRQALAAPFRDPGRATRVEIGPVTLPDRRIPQMRR